MKDLFLTRPLSSLAKVFADEYPPYREMKTLTGFTNEPLAFQIAYCADSDQSDYRGVTMQVESELKLNVYLVELTPSNMPGYPDHDSFVLRDAPGLYPDLLRPYPANGPIHAAPRQWRSAWFELEEDRPAGVYPVTVRFVRYDKVIASETVTVTIFDSALPESGVRVTNWFHTDCLSTWYQAPVFSERYWEIVESYAACAAKHGINLLLTPVFTPALDTQIGGERPTVQLVDVTVTNGAYSFGFDKLDRWIAMCDRVGIRYFEISHLFTQWGAAHAPKIMATVDGEYRRIFGWETDSAGPEYTAFIRAFGAAFTEYAAKKGIQDRCMLHVSDEPGLDVMDAYTNRAKLIHESFPGYRTFDALSSPEFYDTGAVPCPVPAVDHIEPFIERNIDGLWGYYCCGQHRKGVPNRFFNMPSVRNRVLGFLMYKYRMGGFLQWGFNFWYSQLSRYPIDPFRVSDADFAFPSGDAYEVYPGEDGKPLCSLRLKVFREAFNDLRALKLLESKIGREKTMELLESEGEITFSDYPKSDAWLLSIREKVNAYFA